MKKTMMPVLLLSASLLANPVAAADCQCTKGGLGLKLGPFFVGVGGKNYKNLKGCETAVGTGLSLGGQDLALRLGAGYDQGMLGIGLGVRDQASTTTGGFSIGFDYSKCRLVWPYEE